MNAAAPGFCRDCLAEAGTQSRCGTCGSPRLVRHDEIDTLTIAHVDCDAFYAAVEKRDDPSLKDKPVIIGGGRRGVVSTACYIARIDGVHSAMPMFKALKACPNAVVIRPDMKKYAHVGRQVREIMRRATPLVEPLSIDEAFLDLTGTERLHGRSPARTLAAMALEIERDIGITISSGLAANKFLAKIASDLDKPRGFSVIGAGEAAGFLAQQPVGLIWGVGKAMQARLARDGIRRIGQLQTMDEHTLMGRYGSLGKRLYHLARGEDRRRVNPASGAKSISAETTFAHDITDIAGLEERLWRLCEKVSARAKAQGLAGETAVLKLKTADFRTLTRNRKLDQPTQLADRLFRAAKPLLTEAADGRAFRLIGIGIGNLCAAETADAETLFDPDATRRAKAEQAMDVVREKFGQSAVTKGVGLGKRQRN